MVPEVYIDSSEFRPVQLINLIGPLEGLDGSCKKIL
jgi:hypothetical protein